MMRAVGKELLEAKREKVDKSLGSLLKMLGFQEIPFEAMVEYFNNKIEGKVIRVGN